MSMTMAAMTRESCGIYKRRFGGLCDKNFEGLYLCEYLELSVQIGVKYWKQFKV